MWVSFIQQSDVDPMGSFRLIKQAPRWSIIEACDVAWGKLANALSIGFPGRTLTETSELINAMISVQRRIFPIPRMDLPELLPRLLMTLGGPNSSFTFTACLISPASTYSSGSWMSSIDTSRRPPSWRTKEREPWRRSSRLR